MKKFPADVTTAESLTNGDINIINDPKFVPEKKESYSEIFGSGKKKNKKDSEITPRSKVRTATNVTPYRPITHQRFINKVLHGESDHTVKTLIQANSSSDDSTSRNPYKCHICKFETSRVNVIVAHHRLFHSSKNSINWTGSESRIVRKKPVYKSRKIKTKKIFDTSKEDFIDEDVSEKKKSQKSKSFKDKTKTPEKVKSDGNSSSPSKRRSNEDSSPDASCSKKPRFTDVLLADWNEDDEEDKKEPKDAKITEDLDSKTDIPLEDGETKSENENENENASASLDSTGNSDSPVSGKNQTEKMSCFDFDEEEEGFIGMSNANTYGRKIPRVIPVKDKPELGMDLDIEELFKKKNEAESETEKEEVPNEEETEVNGEENDTSENTKENDDTEENEREVEADEELIEDDKKSDREKSTPNTAITKRRRSKASKDEEQKITAENSLALRRTRRPGAKKSYLNEVIEKIEDQDSKNDPNEKKENEETEVVEEVIKPTETVKVEASSSSRRKQDFKNQTMDSDREEMVYSDIVNNEQKTVKSGEGTEKKKGKSQNLRREVKDDFSAQIDSLLEETKLSNLPTLSDSPNDKIEKPEETKSNTTSFSFDYLPNEQTGKKTGKARAEVKSISRMFGDSIPNSSDIGSDGDSQNSASQAEFSTEVSEEMPTLDSGQGKTVQMGNMKFSSTGNVSQKRGSIVLSTVPKTFESSVKVMPIIRQTNSSKDCIVLPAGKKLDTKDGEQSSEGEASQRLKNIKTIKVKPDSLPPSLIRTGKLKGQTIIHQKSGKYVIVTQPPQLGRQRVAPGKVQSGSKVVIVTNQLGEQKIITTSGLQQTKFKVEGQKIMTAPDSAADKEPVSTASTSQSQTQPVIKMVPDGKGGIMKQLTVSPKKVLLGSTKVLVSASGSTFSSGNNVQKIALSSGGSATRTGGDFRLIENYKGSGKTVLIQGSPNPSSGVVLKSSSVVPRQVTKVIQNPQALPALKKKPKILMRASTGQGEYVMQSASGTIESPAYVVKQKGTDGKFSAQKIVRTEIVNQGKVTPTGTSTKRFFLSGQGSNKKGESFIITTNEAVPSKVIRMRQKVKDVDGNAAKTGQKMVSKASEVYAIAQNSLLLPPQSSTESETPQIVQIQAQSQQPVLQTQVIAMPGPVGADGNQTYVLVSVDEHGVVQGVDNSVVAYDASGQQDQIFVNSTSTGNVILLNPQSNDDVAPVFSTSSQDILAEALANTNVLEGSINNDMDSVVPSILLPPSIPSSVVQETSITLQKPIMTPLEMPSSVAPDTSGLEPPPLPPTPTNEDVLMEEPEMPVTEELTEEQLIQHNKKEGELSSNDAVQTYLQPQNFDGASDNAKSTFQVTDFSKEVESQKIFEDHFDGTQKSDENPEERKGSEFFQGELQENAEEDFKELPREEFIIENSQEEQSTNSFQSMPLLNDEPDTSDDAQGSEPIVDQQFEAQKSRLESEQLSQLIREQEPPSSTINEINNQENSGLEFESSHYHQIYESENRDNESKNKESEEKRVEDQNAEEEQEKDVIAGKESQSMPVIADESNTNTFDVDPIYTDVLSQKRFQEETEVSSTTDEYANKDVSN